MSVKVKVRKILNTPEYRIQKAVTKGILDAHVQQQSIDQYEENCKRTQLIQRKRSAMGFIEYEGNDLKARLNRNINKVLVYIFFPFVRVEDMLPGYNPDPIHQFINMGFNVLNFIFGLFVVDFIILLIKNFPYNPVVASLSLTLAIVSHTLAVINTTIKINVAEGSKDFAVSFASMIFGAASLITSIISIMRS